MHRFFSLFLLPFCLLQMFSQSVNYSPEYFGPNAMPVPDFTDARIPQATTVSLSGNYYFGFGDQTVNPELKIEIPLLPQSVSLKLWVPLWESYSVSQAVYNYRQMNGKLADVTSGGNIYVQTRISLFKEKRYRPAVVLNSTLISASGSEFEERRYFDTPGYYFDVELGKSLDLPNSVLNTVRFAADLGFLCWETTNSTQNDAFMYGTKIILSNRYLDFENTLSGYNGWIDNGDKPMIYSSKLIGKFNKFSLFAKYQYGILNFPYHSLQLGFSLSIKKLTPKF